MVGTVVELIVGWSWGSEVTACSVEELASDSNSPIVSIVYGTKETASQRLPVGLHEGYVRVFVCALAAVCIL